LIEHQADVNAVNNNARSVLIAGVTAFILTSLNGHIDIVRVLLENQANVNAINNDGFTVLMIASQNGPIDIVRVLLEHQADVNAVKRVERASGGVSGGVSGSGGSERA
jgi:uncharacterized protein